MDSTTAFPRDLLQAQHDWNTTYRALATPRPAHNTTLRRRLLRLSAQLWWHPYWGTVPSVPAARVELREAVRTHEALTAA